MDTDDEQPDQSAQNQSKVFGYVLVVCLAAVVAVVLNGLGSPSGTTQQPGVAPATVQSPGPNLPQVPQIIKNMGGVPSSAQKAGEILDDGLDVSQQAVDAAGTAVDAGTKVVDVGARMVDDFFGNGVANPPATTAPSNSPKAP